MNQAARPGAILMAGYFAVLALEVLWMSAGAKWFPSAREWAQMHGPRGAASVAVIVAIGLATAYGVGCGRRWAWFVAVIWMAAASVASLALAAVMLFGPFTGLFIYSHPAEALMGVFQLPFCMGSLFFLVRKATRDGFIDR